MPTLKLPISEEDLAKLEGEGDFAFFVALPMDGEQKVVHVHLRHRKFYDLVHAPGGVAGDRHSHLHTPLIEGARLEREE